ncbi:MAG TPA: hypothetical protein VJM83_05215, partial [Nitrospirota bacterium]|nr:hypothetical protein [Nitrospirota bacterium]
GSGYINLTGSGITGSSTSGIQLSRTFHQTNITKSGIYMCATGVLADYGAVNIYGTRSDSYISYCTNYGVKATDGGRAYVSGVSYSNNLPADTYTDTGYGSVIN